jgi:ketosteroid isomerase-like protein
MTTPTDVVLALYAKLTAGDAPGALALMTDDVEWIPMMHYKVDGRGPQKVLEGMLIPAMIEWETFTLTPSEFVAEGNKVVSIGRFRSPHRTTGKSADVNYAHVWEVRDDKIYKFCQYIDTAAIEAVRYN